MNVLFSDRLIEYTLNQLSTSGITNKSIQKDGLGKAAFIKAILNYPQSLHLLYEAQSSHDDNKHFSVNGQLMAGLQNGYAVQLHFINIANILPNNFLTLSYAQQASILQNVFDNADVKVGCDCGSFYWQGMNEEDDKKDVSYYKFSGQPGTGVWQDKHLASGLPHQGQQICKHIYNVVEQLSRDIPVILKYLTSGQTTSQADSTEQVDQLEVQEQPAGLPKESKQGIPKEQTINSEKAGETVSADIENVKSNNELQNAPTLETSEVEARSDKAETEAQEGEAEVEPPIEKPQIPDELAGKKEDILEEPLDTQTKHPMNESIYKKNKIYYHIGSSALADGNKLEATYEMAGGYKAFFMAENPAFLKNFNNRSHIYKLLLTRPLKIFNAFNPTDLSKLRPYKQKKIYNSLKDSSVINYNLIEGDRALIKDIIRLGYDGFIVSEHITGEWFVKGNIGLFNPQDCVKVVDVISKKDDREKWDELIKHKLLESLREELFYRGYKNDMLFQSSELLPNENSKVLFLATDAEHAFQFAVGQTTVGDEMIFEVYDIPVKKLNIYNLQDDPEKIREASIKLGGTGVQYFDQETMIDLLKEKGYDAWTKLDYTFDAEDDSPPGYNRKLTNTWELAIFDKKFKPIERIISKNGEFSNEQLKYLMNKYDIPYFRNIIWDNEYDDNDQFNMNDYFDDLDSNNEENEKKKDKLNQERDAQDAGQLNLFDNDITDRQIKRKKMLYMARALDGYETDKKFNEIINKLENEGYSREDIIEVNDIINKVPKDISEGYSSNEWIKFNQFLSDYLSEEEDKKMEESFKQIYDICQLRESEKKELIGNCNEVGEGRNTELDYIYSDATEFANDLGYYATFDDLEDPEESNFEEISEIKFQLNCGIPSRLWKKDHAYTFLRRKDDEIYILYDENDDIHYIFA